MASRPGQKRRAVASLMITTPRFSSASSSVWNAHRLEVTRSNDRDLGEWRVWGSSDGRWMLGGREVDARGLYRQWREIRSTSGFDSRQQPNSRQNLLIESAHGTAVRIFFLGKPNLHREDVLDVNAAVHELEPQSAAEH